MFNLLRNWRRRRLLERAQMTETHLAESNSQLTVISRTESSGIGSIARTGDIVYRRENAGNGRRVAIDGGHGADDRCASLFADSPTGI